MAGIGPVSFLARLTVAAAALLAAAPVAALDLSWSGFGTVGWAQSNRDWRYERSVDDDGSAERDSRFGLQLDARLGDGWSATLQARLAPALDRDDAWEVTPAWAFVGWRPGDDWLLRAGRMRVPFYLYSEQIDVGATHEMAHLPAEMYAIAPSNDFDGAAATRTWSVGGGELSLDAYAGRARTTARLWSRDGIPGTTPAGARFVALDVRLVGAALAWRDPDTTVRASVHHARVRDRDGGRFPVRPVPVQWFDGSRFYQVGGPGVDEVDSIRNVIVTVGVERRIGADWRVVAELARGLQRDTELGSDTVGGYVAVSRPFGSVTPYVSLGRLLASGESRDWHRRLTGETLAADPAGMPPGSALLLNAAQRYAAEGIYAADQSSLALGVSWTPAPGRKLKLEWQRTAIGQMSRLADTPPGSPSMRETDVDVWTLNYSFAF